MAVVTEFQYALENRLIKKIDIMVDRCYRDKVEKDSVMINDGSEGEGKTNSSVAEAVYARWRGKEKYGVDREIYLWFRLEQMIDFAKRTEKKIIIWDEPSLDALKKDAVTSLNTMLERLLMTCRVKRHFFIINMTKFHKFSEYIVVDRALGLVHLYSRKEIEPGRFIYIKKRKLEPLYQTYLSKHKRMYQELRDFGGQFPEIMIKHFDKMGIYVNGIPNATLQIYRAEKMKAIESIGTIDSGMSKKEAKLLKENKELKYKISDMPNKFPLTQKILAQHFGVHRRTFIEWKDSNENKPFSLGKQGFEGGGDSNITTLGLNQHDFDGDGDDDEDIGQKNQLIIGEKPLKELTARTK